MAPSWRQIHRAAYAEAMRAHRDLEIDTTRRIDPFAALESSGVLTMRRPLDHLAGVYFPPQLSDDGVPGVLVNVMHPASKQRYTAAHELAHHRRDHQLALDRDTEWMARGENRGSDAERFAEAFAAWFLMPRTLVNQFVDTLALDTEHLEPQGAYALSLALGTSYAATIHHLVDMQRITAAQRRALLRIAPQSIKESLGGLPAVADNRRNVWRVHPPGVLSPVIPTEGDAVVIEVPEAPSSGYIWEPSGIPSGIDLVLDEYRTPDDTVLGGSGYHRFLFQVASAGQQILTLAMRRPWLPDEIAETFRVAITTEAAPSPGIVQPDLLVANAA